MKAFVVSHGSGYYGMLEQLGFALATDYDMKPVVVVFTGGTDIGPHLYGQEPGPHTGAPDRDRDWREERMFKECVARGIPMLGICRGAQLLSALSGAALHQHEWGHTQSHPITTSDGEEVMVTSTHHQIIDLSEVPEDNYKLLAYATHRETKDAEAVWWPHTKALAVQFHPEYMPIDSEGYTYFSRLVEEYIYGSPAH